MKTAFLRPLDLVKHTAGNPHVYYSGEFAMIRSLNSIRDTVILDMVRTPQLVEFGRVVLITGGTATFCINLLPYKLQRGDVLIIPQNNYISISDVTDDFDGEVISFNRIEVMMEKCAYIQPAKEDFMRIRHYVNLIWEIVQQPYDDYTLRCMQNALISDLRHLGTLHDKADTHKPTRSRLLFQKFLDIHGSISLPRSVKACADYLCVSPNHLSAIVQKESGRTVMDWLNAYCILRAQVMLRHTDTPVYEIAEQLGFQSATFFSRFFRRETGQTPSEYRNGKQALTMPQHQS